MYMHTHCVINQIFLFLLLQTREEVHSVHGLLPIGSQYVFNDGFVVFIARYGFIGLAQGSGLCL